MIEPVELRDEEAVAFLNGHKTVRDGMLVGLTLQVVDFLPTVILTFEMYLETPVRLVTLELRGVTSIAFNSDDRLRCYYVEELKCLWLSPGELYLSLDPYDEREKTPSEEDNDLFRASAVLLTARYKQ